MITVAEGEEFSGVHAINEDGFLHLPMLRPVPAVGLTGEEMSDAIARHLVDRGLFRKDFVQVSVAVVRLAEITVSVEGAVYQAGGVSLNRRTTDDSRVEAPLSGDSAGGRTLTAALQAAAGVRPDADVTRIVLRREGRPDQVYDLSGALTGRPYLNPTLTAGDHIVVPVDDCFHDALVRPSPVTPPGIRVYASNLTQPASSNAQSAISKDTTSLPYGTRFLQALVASNCVGGTQATNASRSAVLISANPATGESLVISRGIDTLLASAHRDRINPYLLPGDALACYDSTVTNFRDVMRTIVEVVAPVGILGILAE